MNTRLQKAKKLFLAAGIPAFLGTALLEGYLYRDVVAGLFAGLLAFVVYGILFPLLGFGFTRFPRSSRGITILHYVLLMMIGFVLSLPFVMLVIEIPKGSWIEINPPAEEIDHLLSAGNPTIFGNSLYVQAKSGNVYMFECQTYQGCEWKQTQYPDSSNEQYLYFPCHSDRSPKFLPIAPGKIIESFQSAECGPDYTIFIKYIRTQDGRIYGWTSYQNPYEALFLLFGFAIMGLIVGLSTSIAVYSLRPFKKALEIPQSEVIEPRDSANPS